MSVFCRMQATYMIFRKALLLKRLGAHQVGVVLVMVCDSSQLGTCSSCYSGQCSSNKCCDRTDSSQCGFYVSYMDGAA